MIMRYLSIHVTNQYQRSVNDRRTGIAFHPDKRLVSPISLPSLRSTRTLHFINLTNGLEAVPLLYGMGIKSLSFIRLQSTHCEQGNFELMVQSLDANLLLHLALGHCCLVYDFGSRNKKRGAPRALWYGLEFVRYCLSKIWFPDISEPVPTAFLRGHDVSRTFDESIRNLSKTNMKKIKYYRQFCRSDQVPPGEPPVLLYGVYNSTEHDADEPYYQKIAWSWDEELQKEDDVWSARHETFPFEPVSKKHDRQCLHPLEDELGLRFFLGGISHADYSFTPYDEK